MIRLFSSTNNLRVHTLSSSSFDYLINQQGVASWLLVPERLPVVQPADAAAEACVQAPLLVGDGRRRPWRSAADHKPVGHAGAPPVVAGKAAAPLSRRRGELRRSVECGIQPPGQLLGRRPIACVAVPRTGARPRHRRHGRRLPTRCAAEHATSPGKETARQ